MSIAFDEIKNFKIGDVFYECSSGINIRARVTSVPEEGTGHDNRRTFKWTAENTENGEKLSYLKTEGLEHYGARLYTEPQYGYFKDGEFSYKLYGAKT